MSLRGVLAPTLLTLTFLALTLPSFSLSTTPDCEDDPTGAPQTTPQTSQPPPAITTPFPSTCCAKPPTWDSTYFEPSLYLERNPIAPADISLEASALSRGLPCNTPIPNTTHTVTCTTSIPGGGWALTPSGTPTATILYLAGWSSDLARDDSLPTGAIIPFFVSLIQAAAPALNNVRIVAPIPPYRNVSASPLTPDNSGTTPRSWFDFLQVPVTTETADLLALQWDRLGLHRTALRVQAVVDAERCLHAIPADRIFVFGQSFGAAASYHVALTTDIPFAGVFTSAGYVPLVGDYLTRGAAAVNAAGKGYPFTAVHGVNDTVIPLAFGKAAAEVANAVLAPLGGAVKFVPLPEQGHTSIFRDQGFATLLLGAIAEALV